MTGWTSPWRNLPHGDQHGHAQVSMSWPRVAMFLHSQAQKSSKNTSQAKPSPDSPCAAEICQQARSLPCCNLATQFPPPMCSSCGSTEARSGYRSTCQWTLKAMGLLSSLPQLAECLPAALMRWAPATFILSKGSAPYMICWRVIAFYIARDIPCQHRPPMRCTRVLGSLGAYLIL